MALDKKTAVGMYRTMLLIRRFEEMLYHLFSTRDMPGTMHQYNGEEAVAAGVCAHLSASDYITSTHRGHGHCIAKGADLRAVMAEMFAKSTGCCRGMGGSMHIADFDVGMLGANGIVAGGIPIAVGAGITCQVRRPAAGPGAVSVAFFGDGAVNEGAFHEAANLASAWRLPVIFVCENNLYGFSTHYRRVTPIADIADRAAGYGITGTVVDGMDAEAVYEAAGAAVRAARDGAGPAFLECKTYRFRGHSRSEPSTYRTQEELEDWKKRDPIPRLAETLRARHGVTDPALEAVDAEVSRLMDDAVKFAEQSPDPAADDWRRYIYAP